MNWKDRGFTDQLYWLNFRCTWAFVIVCVIITVFSGVWGITDLSLVSYGIPTAFAELGVHTGYIVWKAKCENLNKHPVIIEDGDVSEIKQAIGFQVDDTGIDYIPDEMEVENEQ